MARSWKDNKEESPLNVLGIRTGERRADQSRSPDAEQGQTSPPDVPVFEEMDSVGHVADLIEQEQRNVHQQDPDKDEAGHLHTRGHSCPEGLVT